MIKTDKLGNILLEIEENMGSDAFKNMAYLQNAKKKIKDHPYLDLINYYIDCRLQEMLDEKKMKKFFISSPDEKKLEEKTKRALEKKDYKEAHKTINELINITKKDGYNNPSTNLIKRHMAIKYGSSDSEFHQIDYSIKYLNIRYRITKKISGKAEALREIRECERDMELSAPYHCLLAKCLYMEGFILEAYDEINKAFKFFLSKKEASEIYRTIYRFKRLEKNFECASAALVAAHAWDPENKEVIKKAKNIDFRSILQNKNIKEILLKNKIPPMPENIIKKIFNEIRKNKQAEQQKVEEMLYCLELVY